MEVCCKTCGLAPQHLLRRIEALAAENDALKLNNEALQVELAMARNEGSLKQTSLSFLWVGDTHTWHEAEPDLWLAGVTPASAAS